MIIISHSQGESRKLVTDFIEDIDMYPITTRVETRCSYI